MEISSGQKRFFYKQFNESFRDLRVLTTLKLGHNRIQSFQGYFFLRTVEFLDLSHNALTSVGNEAMIGDNMQNLKQLRLNENQLVLCDAFFYQISRLPYLQALDLKQANMPCVCDIPVCLYVSSESNIFIELSWSYQYNECCV